MKFNGMTVREMLNLPILKDATLVSGAGGLDRIVRYIDIMEIPDIEGWLREGELILTTGYSIRHDPGLLTKLVEHLANAGAAGVALKPERFIHYIPQAMIDMGNRHNIPIIQLPDGIPYVDITYPVMELILDKQGALLRRSEEIYKTLTSLVLNNSGIQAVADNVAELLRSPIRVVNRAGDVLVASPPGSQEQEQPPASDARQWDITVDKQTAGKLIVEKQQLDALELVCIEQARLVFALELMRRKIADDTETRLRGNFFEELLMGLPLSIQDVENKGRQLGLAPEWTWEIAMIEGERSYFEEHAAFMGKINELISRESRNRQVRSHVLRQGDRLLLLLSSPRTDDREWSESIKRFVRSWSHVRTGFGTKYPLWEIQRSYVEAKKAVMIGSRLDKIQRFFRYDEVELFSLLLDSSDYVNFDSLVEKHLGKLLEYDQENGTDLMVTLYHYLAEGGSLIEAANRLYIHRNSVKYRLDRIKDIADIDLDGMQKRLTYYLCTAFHLLKNKG
ncbi:Purine catabolism regulatory protein [Paenibacillus konkukensis]|uniref:Purine catabolism regulatory protein n=1 Tax=Paenibacillus konkukensis TaxID=2020716 RepID=A0ABY4RKC4_9BACL|nr:PucR family transcriptional regulator [Paenibacillus konkukensis]UQZ82914.1 Purine catabolism regulatory protein [Paenibacillus konkukensis]